MDRQHWLLRVAALSLGLIGSSIVSGCCTPSCEETEEPGPAFPVLTGDYLGQKPPGLEPELFAPGIVSTGLDERDLAMTPDGREIYFCVQVGNFNFAAILVTRLEQGSWTRPEVAPFSGHYMDIEPCISPDGQRFFFLSNRPLPGSLEPVGNEDIWVMDRVDGSWSEPRNVGPPVNSEAAEFFPSVTRDDTLYFTRRDEDRTEHIYRSRQVDGTYREPERLPEQVNCGATQFNAFIAPDESYLIVCVYGREDSIGGVDYYVVFRSVDDAWSEPVNMGPELNTAEGREWSPSVSPDGRYLFFMSSRAQLTDHHSPTRMSYDSLLELAGQPQNGHTDIWWVDASIIETMRPG